jgi:predicted homoserine dehydrogenase-like protein
VSAVPQQQEKRWPKNQKKIRVGVVGVGSLGQWHARIYSEMPDVELAGVYDADKKRAKEIAERYHTAPFKTVEELAEATEALSIVVPTDKHRAVAGMVIEKGGTCWWRSPSRRARKRPKSWWNWPRSTG